MSSRTGSALERLGAPSSERHPAPRALGLWVGRQLAVDDAPHDGDGRARARSRSRRSCRDPLGVRSPVSAAKTTSAALTGSNSSHDRGDLARGVNGSHLLAPRRGVAARVDGGVALAGSASGRRRRASAAARRCSRWRAALGQAWRRTGYVLGGAFELGERPAVEAGASGCEPLARWCGGCARRRSRRGGRGIGRRTRRSLISATGRRARSSGGRLVGVPLRAAVFVANPVRWGRLPSSGQRMP